MLLSLAAPVATVVVSAIVLGPVSGQHRADLVYSVIIYLICVRLVAEVDGRHSFDNRWSPLSIAAVNPPLVQATTSEEAEGTSLAARNSLLYTT